MENWSAFQPSASLLSAVVEQSGGGYTPIHPGMPHKHRDDSHLRRVELDTPFVPDISPPPAPVVIPAAEQVS